MHYKNILLCKFIKNQNVVIYSDNNTLIISTNQVSGTPGIRLNGVIAPCGSYQIILRVTLNENDVFFWSTHIPNQKIQLQNGENIIPFSTDKELNFSMGLSVSNPRIGSKFLLHSFEMNKMELSSVIERSATHFPQKKINDYFSHVYVINLDNRKDRLFRINRMLVKYNVRYERISGIIANINQFEQCKKNGSKIINIGALGCLLSHLYTLNDALDKKYDSVLILEDDVFFDHNFTQKVMNIEKAPDWDILYLGCSQHNKSFDTCLQNVSKGFYKAYQSSGTFAIAIKRHMYEYLIKLFESQMMNVDTYLEDVQKTHKCYVMYENLIIADVSDSDIGKPRDIMQYGKKFGWKNSNYYPNVSIIVPVFNGSNYLSECLDSIQSQTYTNYEIVIVNDASTDTTVQVINQFADKYPNINIIWLTHDVNKGLPQSLNDGFAASHGSYLTWISHDNKFKPNALKLMVEFLDIFQDYLLVTAGHEFIGDTQGKIFGTAYTNDSILNNFHGVAGFMYRRTVLNIVGQYDVDLYGIEDLDYWVRILESPPHKSGCIREILCEFRKHREQLTHKFKDKYTDLKKIMMIKRDERLKKSNVPQLIKLNVEKKENIMMDQIQLCKQHVNTKNITPINIFPELAPLRQLGNTFRSVVDASKSCPEEEAISKQIKTTMRYTNNSNNPNTFDDIIKRLDNCKDTIIYPPTVKYSVLLQRPQQILKSLTRHMNCIFITKDEDYEYKIDGNVIVLKFETYEKVKRHIGINKIILYYTDPRTYNYIDIIKPNFIIFDLIDNPIEEFAVWKPNLSQCVKTADIVTYSSIYLLRVLKEIDQHKQYIYLSNGCDYEYFKQANKKLERPENMPNDKIIIGYYGYIATWMDYEIIKKIADIPYVHVMMIGLIQNQSVIPKHKNITWTGHIKYENLVNYLSWFDICLIPFKNTEMMLGCNPIKLHEYMATNKPIISTLKFQDVIDGYNLITSENVLTVIDNIIQNGLIEKNSRNVIKWTDIGLSLYRHLLNFKNNKECKKKRVAYITNMLLDWTTLNPRYGGGERYALEIAKMLQANNIDIHFFQKADTTCDSTYYGFPVHCINHKNLESNGEFSVGYSKLVNDMVKKDGYDYVIYGMPEMCCSENVLTNSISINHGIWFDRLDIKKDQKWYNLMLTHIKHPCANVSVDTNFINFIRVTYPEYVHKLNYVPNFYDPEVYKFSVKHNDKLNIIIPRRANIYRGSRLMEDMLVLIPHDVNITWVGKGDVTDNKLLEQLEKKDSRFKFIGCSFDEMSNVYKTADIVVIPTIASEGTSLSCIEAMACGCAVVSTNIGGLCNLVINRFNGLLVNSTAGEIAQAINLLICDKDLRNKLVQNAYNMIKEFEITKWHQKWMNIFENIGWITPNKDTQNNYFKKISRDILIDNFDKYWKNYVHTNKLHHDIKTKEEALNHLLNNTTFNDLDVCNMNIKICILTRNAINGGVESIIYEEAKHLNCDIYVTNGIIDDLNPFLYTNVRNVTEIMQVLNQYNLIIYHWVPEFALHAIKLSGIPSIEYLHRRDTDDNNKLIPTNIVTHSPFMINHCVTKFNKKAILLEHPIDTRKFQADTSISKEYIGCVCTYTSSKGMDILIRAFILYAKHYGLDSIKKYKLVLYGKDQNGYMNELIKLAQENNLDCEFNGIVDTYTIINKYKLFIIPSRMEGLPIVLLEALACNINVIASDIEGNMEFYNLAKARGYDKLFTLFESENEYDLAKKIYEWSITDDSLNTFYKGREYIKKYYSTHNHCNKLLDIILTNIHVGYSKSTAVNIPNPISYIPYCINTITNTISITTCPLSEVSFNKFCRLVIDNVPSNISKIEASIDIQFDDKFSNIPIGYQFDFISTSNTSDVGTEVITKSGILCVCSKEINNSEKIKTININIRPNKNCITIKSANVMIFYKE